LAGHRDRHAYPEDGVLKETCLHQVRLRKAELFVGGLKILVVEQRDLDGRVERQRDGKELSEATGDGLILRAALIPEDVSARALGDEARGVTKGRRRRRGRASREDGENEKRCRANHRETSLVALDASDVVGAEAWRSCTWEWSIPGMSGISGIAGASGDGEDDAEDRGARTEGASSARGELGSFALVGGSVPSAQAASAAAAPNANTARPFVGPITSVSG
jgi:hypothetical protein